MRNGIVDSPFLSSQIPVAAIPILKKGQAAAAFD
jgi:hypothetical protein